MRQSVFPTLVAAALCCVAGLAAQEKAEPKPAKPAPTTAVAREDCVTSECHTGVKDHEFLHGPLQANACDACHRLTDVEQHAYEAVRLPEQMCSHCHVVEIPEHTLPHEPLKQRECLPCHDPHGGTGPALLRGKRYSDLCMTCHQDLTGGRQIVHGPAAASACGACHEPHTAEFPKLLAFDGDGLCLRCHVATGDQIERARLVHAPVQDGCRICHDPHATDNQALLIDDPASLCTGCHQGISRQIDTAATAHGALTTERSCANCHDAHASDNPRLLRTDVMTLCLECHDEELDDGHGGKIADMKAIIEGGTSLHGPTAQRDCTACHRIHGSDHHRLLASEYPDKLYYPFTDTAYALCFNCHDRDLVLEEETETVTAFRNGKRNLHYEHVHRDKKGRSCSICHDSHAAVRENHIRGEYPFGPAGWPLKIEWERTATGGGCAAGCHPAFQYDRVSPIAYPRSAKDEAWRGKGLLPEPGKGPDKEPGKEPGKGPGKSRTESER